MKNIYITLILLFSLGVTGQTTFKKQSFKSSTKKVVDIKNSDPGYNATIITGEAPTPDGESYRSFLMRQKIEQRKRHPIRLNGNTNINKTTEVVMPILGESTSMYRVFFNGTKADYVGGSPNDNTMGINNDGVLIAGVNSSIWAYDFNTDTIIFPNSLVTLASIANEDFGHHYYDPKIIYDPDYDRFILVFLKNNKPHNSEIVVCFSTTNSPLDPWNVYFITGNPLDNNRWTDYPAISLTKDELFVTANLIIPDVSWQVGFDGSVIWQIDKKAGFAGDTDLDMDLYSQIEHEGKYIRNVHPVRGAEGIAEKQYFLSNRNFDLENDTVFVAHLTGNLSDPNTNLIVDYGVTDTKYGVPPNGRQADSDTADPVGGLQTNDARVLGAFLLDDKIQFVANTINHATGLAAVYHGSISSPSSFPEITGKLISDGIMDYGYPNIAFTGKSSCETQSIISFNYTSPTDFAGAGAVFCNNDNEYSELNRIKDGDNYVNRTNYSPGSYERWGDYFGLQRRFNKPGSVYATGYVGNSSKFNTTFVFEMFSPDTNTTATGGSTAQKLYPNPTNYEVNVEFYLSTQQNVSVVISDMNGRLVDNILEDQTCSGANKLVFYTSTLRSGTYVVRILDENQKEIALKKFVKY